MTFKDMLAQVLEWLQHDQRLSYRALKRQFALDDDALEDLKEAILYTHAQVIVDDGRGLVWTGALPPTSATPAVAVQVPAPEASQAPTPLAYTPSYLAEKSSPRLAPKVYAIRNAVFYRRCTEWYYGMNGGSFQCLEAPAAVFSRHIMVSAVHQRPTGAESARPAAPASRVADLVACSLS